MMKQIYTLAIITAGFLFSPAAWGQNNQHLRDSLHQVLTTAGGEDLLKSYNKLTGSYFAEAGADDLKMDTLISLYDRMAAEAKKQSNAKFLGIALINKISAYTNRNQSKTVLKLAPGYLDELEALEAWTHYYSLYRIIIRQYGNAGKYDEAISEANKMYGQAKERGHNYGIGVALYSMALIYADMQRLEEAVKTLREAIPLIKEENSYMNVAANAYTPLCSYLIRLERYDEALQELANYEATILKYEELSGQKQPQAWWNMWLNYADLCYKTGELDKSEEFCLKLEKANVPTRRSAYSELAKIYNERKQYEKALQMVEKSEELSAPGNLDLRRANLSLRIMILCEKTEQGHEIHQMFKEAVALNDTIAGLERNRQLDELRTQYEVDKITVEKEQNRRNFLYALAGLALLLVIIVLILINRQKIRRKNKTLVLQIKELQELQQIKENELLQKTTFQTPETDAAGLCPESRKDKLCLKLRDLLLKEKIYRDDKLSRDSLTERLGINRYDLEDAFKFCFNSSYSEYINELRLKDAVVMLEQSDLPIAEISEKAGFGTLRTFQRQFSAQYNMSPKDYRALARK